MTITELSIKRPSIIIVIFTVLTALGIFSYFNLKYELMPDMSLPYVTISTIYPGASAGEVENGVTKRVEDAVSTLDRVINVHATSQENLSMVMLEFASGTDINVALQEAQRKVNQIASSLPDGVKPPSLSKISFNDFPILQIGVSGNMPARDFYQFLVNRIQPELNKIAGVGQVALIGGMQREIKVNVDSQKLRAYKLSILQVVQAVKLANMDFPTGVIKDSDSQFTVRLAGKISSLEQLRQLIVYRSSSGGIIRLGNIAEVQSGSKDTASISRFNGKTTVNISILKQADANAVQVSKLVRQQLKQLEEDYAKIKLQFNVAMDSSEFTIAAADAVKEDLGLAVLLVALVMLVFLHSIRNSAIVMVAVPASLVSTMIGMQIFGFSLNIVTLLALSLVIGILVDDSIVVLENIHRHLEMRKDPWKAALDGRNEIGFTALSITLVDVVVFVPLALVTGIISGMMRPFSLVIVTSTLMSLFVSFTITPLLASRFARLEHLTKGAFMGRMGIWFEKGYQRLTREYLILLKWGLRHKTAVLLTAFFLFAGGIALIMGGFIGMDFVPGGDRGQFSITLELPAGAKLEETNQAALRVENLLARYPVIDRAIVTIGASGQGFMGQGSNNIVTINSELVPKHKRSVSTDQVVAQLKKDLRRMAGFKSRVVPASIMGGGGQSAVQLVVTGNSWEEVYQAASLIKSTAEKIPGTGDVQLSSELGKPELRVEIDREKMSSLGLTVADVGTALRYALTGDNTSKFRDTDGNDYDINIALDPADRSKTANLGNFTFMNNLGQPVELQEFAKITETTGPTSLRRENRRYGIIVSSQAIGRSAGTISMDIMKKVSKIKFASGIEFGYYGNIKNMMESFLSLFIALLGAIFFIYMVMAALYNSFIYPFIVLFSIPLGIAGSLLAMALTINSMSIFTILGMIMQLGLVTKNAILLVDFTNKFRENGADVNSALVEAGKERLRPILMTTLTMILGMLPVALSNAMGAELKRGLAWALIGGLTVSMIMTLLVVPVVYTIVAKIRENALDPRKSLNDKRAVA